MPDPARFYSPYSMRKIIPVFVLLLAGCSASQIPMTVHKVDIQQGNMVTQDMVAKLKPGMTRAQVRFVLGTPLVVDPFRNDRWDYVYVYQKAGVITEQRRLAVFFKDDKLERVEGDVVPARAESKPAAADKPKPAPSAAAPAAPGAQPAVDATDKSRPAPQAEERGFFGRMLERIGF
jgi:outer membrane protein assembly factor BamE